jgi:hypothetical protein
MLLLLAACTDTKISLDDTGSAGTGDTGTADTATADTSWGTAESCGSYHRGGFNDWVDTDTAILVYGDEDGGLGQQIYDDYSELLAPYIADFEMRAASELTAEDEQHNLFVVGWPAVNPVLQEMNGGLPVWFEDESFVFAGQRWEDADDGIALTSPSPFYASAMVLVFAGNTYQGAYDTLTVMTGAEDYVVVTGEGQDAERGSLCTDTEPWSYVAE